MKKEFIKYSKYFKDYEEFKEMKNELSYYTFKIEKDFKIIITEIKRANTFIKVGTIENDLKMVEKFKNYKETIIKRYIISKLFF